MRDVQNAAVILRAVAAGWHPPAEHQRGHTVADVLYGHGDPYCAYWTAPDDGPRACVHEADATALLLAAEAARVYLATPRGPAAPQ